MHGAKKRKTGLFPPLFWLAFLVALLAPAQAMAACDAQATASSGLGTHSPAAVKAGAVPYTNTTGGFSCTSVSILTLLSGNYLRATVTSGSVLKLTSATTTDQIPYQLAADSGGASPLVPGTATYYINGSVLNLLGLLGTSAINVPIYVKPQSAALAAPGTYTGTFQVRWDWYFCSAISVASLCIGTTDTGSKTTTVTLTMTVAPNPTQVGIVASTTWDPVQSTTIPKAIPGSKLRMTMTVTNPDVVALDVNTVVLAFPTPSLLTIALDGDGTGASTIQMTQGSTPSGLTLSYVSPSSTSDNVDFSSDGGFTWTCYPVAGNAASQATVTHVRFRPQGTMAAGSSFSISIPYSVK